jgi:hypothetical protein
MSLSRPPQSAAVEPEEGVLQAYSPLFSPGRLLLTSLEEVEVPLTRGEAEEENEGARHDCEELEIEDRMSRRGDIGPRDGLDPGEIVLRWAAVAERLRPVLICEEIEHGAESDVSARVDDSVVVSTPSISRELASANTAPNCTKCSRVGADSDENEVDLPLTCRCRARQQRGRADGRTARD